MHLFTTFYILCPWKGKGRKQTHVIAPTKFISPSTSIKILYFASPIKSFNHSNYRKTVFSIMERPFVCPKCEERDHPFIYNSKAGLYDHEGRKVQGPWSRITTASSNASRTMPTDIPTGSASKIGFSMCSVQKSRFIWSQKKFHGRKRRKFRKHRKDQQLCRDATAKGTVQPYEKNYHHIIRWSFFLFGGATARKSWGSHLWCRGKVPENREKPSISTRLSVCSKSVWGFLSPHEILYSSSSTFSN